MNIEEVKKCYEALVENNHDFKIDIDDSLIYSENGWQRRELLRAVEFYKNKDLTQALMVDKILHAEVNRYGGRITIEDNGRELEVGFNFQSKAEGTISELRKKFSVLKEMHFLAKTIEEQEKIKLICFDVYESSIHCEKALPSGYTMDISYRHNWENVHITFARDDQGLALYPYVTKLTIQLPKGQLKDGRVNIADTLRDLGMGHILEGLKIE